MNNRVATFHKVSFEQFFADMLATGSKLNEDAIREIWENIELPERATAGSAGYDFFIPYDVYLSNNSGWVTVPTGIRCTMDMGYALFLFPKSGLGFKFRMRLANTIGVVDADYAYSSNEGHIMVKVGCENSLCLDAGSKFIQGIFLPFGITNEDEATGIRDGGFGSTGVK